MNGTWTITSDDRSHMALEPKQTSWSLCVLFEVNGHLSLSEGHWNARAHANLCQQSLVLLLSLSLSRTLTHTHAHTLSLSPTRSTHSHTLTLFRSLSFISFSFFHLARAYCTHSDKCMAPFLYRGQEFKVIYCALCWSEFEELGGNHRSSKLL